MQAAVILDPLLQVTLGAQVDQLLPGAVFDRQFVVAATGGRATAAQNGFGLVRRQGVRHGGDLVGHAAGNQRTVGITFQVGHHHFHADARNGHCAETFPGPAGRDAYPATALVAVQPRAVPGQLDSNPT
ncbi:hypothetical protein D9M72_619080 [compost metagenome]